jgi:hypothetical protein
LRAVAIPVSIIVVSALLLFQPVFASSTAQVNNVSFAYPQYLNGVYIVKGTVVTVSASIYNGGSQLNTFLVCPTQRVVFAGGSYGDVESFGCATITLGTICSSTSGVVSIPVSVYASATGELQIRISVYDSSISTTVPITISIWHSVTQIVPYAPSY